MSETEVIPLDSASDIDEQAALWVAKLDGGPLSPEEQAQFEAWYHSSARHMRAFDELAELFGHMDILASLRDISVSPPVDAAIRQDQKRHRLPVFAAWAGGTLAACLAVAVLAWKFTGPPDPPQSAYVYEVNITTVRGQQKTIDMADGSTITLNSDTGADILFTGQARDISLVSGEAFFEVAHNANAPFLVTTPYGTVRAVGTAFSVRVGDGQIDVLVPEGRVALSVADAGSQVETDFLDAGETARVSS